MVLTNTGLHEVVKKVKSHLCCSLSATIQRTSLPPPAPGSRTMQHLLAPIGMVNKSCVSVGTDFGQTVCVSDTQRKIKSGWQILSFIHCDFLPEVQPSTENLKFCFPSPDSSNKEKSGFMLSIFISLSCRPSMPKISINSKRLAWNSVSKECGSCFISLENPSWWSSGIIMRPESWVMLIAHVCLNLRTVSFLSQSKLRERLHH